jgi:hypothetical protein
VSESGRGKTPGARRAASGPLSAACERLCVLAKSVRVTRSKQRAPADALASDLRRASRGESSVASASPPSTRGASSPLARSTLRRLADHPLASTTASPKASPSRVAPRRRCASAASPA